MEDFTCTKCGSHDHADFASTGGRIIMICRVCVNAPKIRKHYKCPICGERGHYQKFHDDFMCKRCGSKHSEIYIDKFGRHRRCVECMRVNAKRTHKRNYKPHPKVRHDPKERELARRSKKLKDILNGSKLECAICHLPLVENGKHHPTNETAHIDHDHKTGKIRGVLCMGCNCGIGNFKDSDVLLKAAIAYLKRS